MTDNQVVAAVGAFGALLLLWVVDWMAESATVTLASVLNTLSMGLWERMHLGLGGPTLGQLLGKLSITDHFQDFRKGLLDTQHVVFYASVVFLALFMTQRILESRRWR
jgi:ABC-2 type transport system permease protein